MAGREDGEAAPHPGWKPVPSRGAAPSPPRRDRPRGRSRRPTGFHDPAPTHTSPQWETGTPCASGHGRTRGLLRREASRTHGRAAPWGCRTSWSMLRSLSLAPLCLALLQYLKSQKHKLGALRRARLDQVPGGWASPRVLQLRGVPVAASGAGLRSLTGLQVGVHRSLSGLKSLSSGLAPPRGPGGERVSCLSGSWPFLGPCRSSQPASPHRALAVALTFLPPHFSCEDPVDAEPRWVTQKNLPGSRPVT